MMKNTFVFLFKEQGKEGQSLKAAGRGSYPLCLFGELENWAQGLTQLSCGPEADSSWFGSQLLPTDFMKVTQPFYSVFNTVLVHFDKWEV